MRWGRAVLVLGLGTAALAPRPLAAQVARTDTVRINRGAPRADTTRDTLRAGRALPRSPSRTFPAADSVLQRLLGLEGYAITRFRSDSMRLYAEEKEIRLAGQVLVERDGASLESDTARYVEGNCALFAVGSPRLYDPSGVLFGDEMTYDACNKTGVIGRARTDFQEGSGTWFLYGNLAFDNETDRTFASEADLTSCELEDPHYHFAARQVKYVSKRLMVSRPAVLYVQDVPVLWLPFIFQDMHRGRRSGLIPPQFGVNDIVRNSPTYQRHVANLGYYWALSDYADAQTTIDWYAQRFIALHGRLRYRWLDRFLAGGVAVDQFWETDGERSTTLSWAHQQQFNLATSLTANMQYQSRSQIVSRNAVDPLLAVGTIDSRLNFQRRFAWGQLNIGGSRTQSLDKPLVTTSFPTLTFTPNPIALRDNITWSPGITMTNSLQNDGPLAALIVRSPTRSDSLLLDSRQTNISVQSPLRIGRWNWSNSFTINDRWSNRHSEDTYIDPVDSSRTIRTYAEETETGFDWQTGFGLPILLQGSWNLQPSVQLVNTTGGPFLLRNRYSGGAFVTQGKRLQFAASLSPTVFGLFGGLGVYERIRHSFAPAISWSYSPAADVPEAYARAANQGRLPATLRSQPQQRISVGLSQIFEAKLRPDPATRRDTTGSAPPPEGRKLKLLSVQSDAITFDLEQGRQPGRTAWTTDLWGNTLSSDLLRGFSVRIAHDLWDGPVGFVGSRLAPALTSVALGFSIGANTLRSAGALLGLRTGPARPERPDSILQDNPTDAGRNAANAFQRGSLASRYSAVDRMAPGRGGAQFNAAVQYSLQRSRPDIPLGQTLRPTSAENQMLSGSVTFSPTRHWSASWQSSYDVTRRQFADHIVRLDRDMHDWRATFTFVKSPNGNFLFNFGIQLIDQPDLHFDYDQRNIFR